MRVDVDMNDCVRVESQKWREIYWTFHVIISAINNGFSVGALATNQTHRGQPVKNILRWYLLNMTSERLKCPMSMIKLKTKIKWKWNDTFLYVAIFISQPKIQAHNVRSQYKYHSQFLCDVYLSSRLLSFLCRYLFYLFLSVLVQYAISLSFTQRTINDILLNLITSYILLSITMNQLLVCLI